MRAQVYDFVTGVETETPPTGSDPTLDGDLVPLGYANKSYASGIATVAAIKAIAAAARTDNLPIFCDELNAWFYFDAAAADTGNDLTVLTPDAGTGRWLRLSKKTRFALTDSQAVAANITGMLFDKTKIRSVTMKVVIARGTSTRAASFNLECVTDGTSWEVIEGSGAALPSGGWHGITFTMTSAGQIQYTSDAGASSTLDWKIIDLTEV
jgi:hypothetical protein